MKLRLLLSIISVCIVYAFDQNVITIKEGDHKHVDSPPIRAGPGMRRSIELYYMPRECYDIPKSKFNPMITVRNSGDYKCTNPSVKDVTLITETATKKYLGSDWGSFCSNSNNHGSYRDKRATFIVIKPGYCAKESYHWVPIDSIWIPMAHNDDNGLHAQNVYARIRLQRKYLDPVGQNKCYDEIWDDEYVLTCHDAAKFTVNYQDVYNHLSDPEKYPFQNKIKYVYDDYGGFDVVGLDQHWYDIKQASFCKPPPSDPWEGLFKALQIMKTIYDLVPVPYKP